MANYKNLIAWQKAHKLALLIYKLTESFPRHEQFALTTQLRRAVLSIPTNIVEGYNRKSKKEFVHFIDIALGSVAEVEYLLEFSVDLGYINEADIKESKMLIVEVGKLLWSIQKSQLQP
ncbi:MAG: four helix bundle protein [Nitrospirae bacterium]|jgi:four helix bundle protein|nr:four helix bundle protein [Nitrospirota bacterium]